MDTELRSFIQGVLTAPEEPQHVQGNHIEFTIVANGAVVHAAENACKVYDTCMERDRFYRLMYRMMDTYYKYNQKQYKETIIGNVCCQNHNNEDISIYNITTNRVECFQNQFLAKVQQKNKLTILSLPSTMNTQCESYVRKLIFRVTNRIFVNFENCACDDAKVYRITVNYNHDKDVELSSVVDALEKILKLLM